MGGGNPADPAVVGPDRWYLTVKKVIPEPITAALIPLAVAPLLLRRRRTV